MKPGREISLDEYVDFVRSGQQSDLTVSCLNQIVSMHGFRKISKVKALKKVLVDSLKTIDLIDPSRSTLNEDMSSHALLELDDVIADLNTLNWHECCTTSIKSICKENPQAAEDNSDESQPIAMMRKGKHKRKTSEKGKGGDGVSNDGKYPSSGAMICYGGGELEKAYKKKKKKKKKKLLKEAAAAGPKMGN